MYDYVSAFFKGFIVGFFITTTAFAKDSTMSSRIVAIAGKTPITLQDVKTRIDLTILTSGLERNPQTYKELFLEVVKNLIDENIQLQLAETNKIIVPETEVAKVFENLAQENNMSKDVLEQILNQNGIPTRTLLFRLKAQLAWVKYIRAAYEHRINISDAEIARRTEFLEKNKNETQFEVYEIVVRVHSHTQDIKDAQQRAETIYQQLKKGAHFRPLAREVSDSFTKGNGGYVGWITKGQWDQNLENALETMQVGDVSKPVQTNNGFYILYLAQRKNKGEIAPSQKFVSYAQVRLPVKADAPPEEADRFTPAFDSLMGCRNLLQFQQTATKYGLDFQENKNVFFAQLPAYWQQHVKTIPQRQPIKPPLMTSEGLIIGMIYSIEEKAAELPTKENIQKNLEQEKFIKFATSEMSKLDTAFYKEIRIKDSSVLITAAKL